MFERIKSDMFNIKIKEERDLFNEGIVPLGMVNPIENYMYGDQEEFEQSDELVSYRIDKKNIFAGCMIAPSGVGKSRLTKNIVRAYQNAGWKIVVFDAKSFEFNSAKKIGKSKRKHPFMKNTKLKVASYVASYVENEVPEHLKKEFKVFSNNIKTLKTREHWSSLGFSSKSADFCVSQLENGVEDINVLEARFEEDDTLLGITKKSALSSISLILGTKFFNKNRKQLDIKKHFDNDEIISISFFSKGGNLMSSQIGLIIEAVKNIGAEELKKGPQYVTKKLIVMDDALYYLDSSQVKQGETSLAVKEALNIANNYRSFGLGSLVITQSSSLIDFKIIESCNHFFIAKIRRPSSLLDIVDKDVYKILNSSGGENEPTPLKDDQDRYIREWIFIQGSKWQRFFPFDVTVGHE